MAQVEDELNKLIDNAVMTEQIQNNLRLTQIKMRNKMDKRIIETSKFLSYVLRHAPESIDIVLDREGWTDIVNLIHASMGHGKQIDSDLIKLVVDSSDKQRFAISDDGLRIRASQGHSAVGVDITFKKKNPLNFFFTAPLRDF